MKKIIKRILPHKAVSKIMLLRKRMNAKKQYKFDYRRLLKYAYSMKSDYSQENLRAKITFHYHAIEKGLSKTNLRYGFGRTALCELFWAMDQYIDKQYPTDDFRFQSAISVLCEYVRHHEKSDVSIDWVKERLNRYHIYLTKGNEYIGGIQTIYFDEVPEFEKMTFSELSKNRWSVRDYGTSKIDDEKVFEAIEIAKRTPSVCNRQSWKVRYVKSQEKINEVLDSQGGFSGNGENLRGLIVVSADKQYMNGGHERNQTYIDGGMFSMSLIYSLTSVGIASCTLNASFPLSTEFEMRDLLKIEDSEDLIVIIAIGSYPDIFKVAKSPRDNYLNFTTIL